MNKIYTSGTVGTRGAVPAVINIAAVERAELTDGSTATNVILSVGDVRVRIACIDDDSANDLAAMLNEAAWVEVA